MAEDYRGQNLNTSRDMGTPSLATEMNHLVGTAATELVGAKLTAIPAEQIKNKTLHLHAESGTFSLRLGDLTAAGSELASNITLDNTLGAEILSNPDFATDTVWAKGTGWTISGDTGSSDGTQGGDSDLTEAALGLTTSALYEVTFTVSNYSAGNVTPVVGDTEGTDRGANGTFTETIACGAGDDFDLRADLNFIGDVDDVSLRLATTPVWVEGTGWLLSDGSAECDGTQSADSDLYQDISGLVVGELYTIGFTIANYSAGNLTAYCGGTEGTDVAANGSYTQDIIYDGTNDQFGVRADLNFVGDVDDFSVKRAIMVHTATPAASAIGSARFLLNEGDLVSITSPLDITAVGSSGTDVLTYWWT